MKAKEYVARYEGFLANPETLRGMWKGEPEDWVPDKSDAVICIAKEMATEMLDVIKARRVATVPGVDGAVREFDQKWKAFARRADPEQKQVPPGLFIHLLKELTDFVFDENDRVVGMK